MYGRTSGLWTDVDSSAKTSNDGVGAPKPAKNRFNGPNKHRLTGSPSDSKASSLGDA